MKRLFFFSVIAVTLASALSFTSDQLFTIPRGWSLPSYDFSKNQLTREKVELGRALFYDPILSRTNIVSCASCHLQYTAFTHVDHALSHGVDDRIGTRNSPALMNLAWQKDFMWDGAVNHLDVQALAPIHNSVEMDETIDNVVKKLTATNNYPQLFEEAFGGGGITGERTLKSLSQFLLTLVSSTSKYDSVSLGTSSSTEKEKNGYSLFKSHCNACHAEPLFTTGDFANNGLPIDTVLRDAGRWTVTHNSADSMLFKIPTLRNVEFSYPYMHDGRLKSLKEVVQHYTSGIQHSNTLSNVLRSPIALTSNEQVDLIAFLLTLTDRQFLFDKRFSFPRRETEGK